MKKKIRILSLCFVLLAAVTVFAVTPFAFAEGEGNSKVTVVDASGNPVTDVALPQGEKVTLTANAELTGDVQYQWQILADADSDLWVNISGENAKTIEASYAMVCSVLQNNETSLRCVATGDESATGSAVKVTVTEPQTKAAPAKASAAKANDAADTEVSTLADEGESGDDVRDTYNIVINYVFEDNSPAANPWTATVAAGSNYAQDVISPTIVGYKPDQDVYKVSEPNIQEDKTYTVTYYPDQVNYTVKHYLQNVDDDGYTLNDTETKTGYTNSPVSASLAKGTGDDDEYAGFTALFYDTTTKIAADGSTVVEIYYDRNYYLLSLNLDGGYGSEPVYARYGSAISVDNPQKAGYTFAGWDPQLPDTMPVGGDKLTATWTAGSANYSVQYWQENANDDNYSYVDRESRTATVGSTVSGSNDKSYSGFTYDHADLNVVVKGDGSSVVNVYYKRNIYEVKFYNNRGDKEDTTKRITAKHGAFIGDKWPGNGWYVNKNSENTAQSYLAVMPLGGKNFYGQQTGSSTATATYYVEVLPGGSGTTVSGKTYKVHHNDSAKYDRIFFGGELKVTDEERYDLEGFTCNTSISTKNGNDYNGAKFYYTRNQYELVFDDNYGSTVSEQLPFEQVLSESTNHKNNYVPNYPSQLEEGAYTFGGWYTDPGCTQAVDWSAKMPAAKVVLYAKWTPVIHTVETWLTNEKKEPVNIGDTGKNSQDVPHGTVATAPADPENGSYKFVGWFYMEDGVEKAFDFAMPVTKDLKLYAKWNSNVPVKYTIRYVLEGTDTEIAPKTEGSALAGTTKTFDAKAGTELDKDYQTGYFPKTSSHSLTMSIDGENVWKFEYVQIAKVKYTVKYLEKGTETPLHEEKTDTTSNAVITEKFEVVRGYRPDAYQKRLVLSANEEENVLIFWYETDNEHAPVQINHWIQNIAGNGYSLYQNSTDLNGVFGETYNADILDIPGFYQTDSPNPEDKDHPCLTGAVLTKEMGQLELNVYYDRNVYPFEFRFLKQGTDEVLHAPITGEQRYQAQVTQNALMIPGYDLVGPENLAITIAIENPDNVAKNNVKTFYYKEQDATIHYKVVGPANSGTVDPSGETIPVLTGNAQGSTPTAKPGYRFVGWFRDEACTDQITGGGWISTGDKLVPQKTKELVPATEDGNDAVLGFEFATYYAKFEPDVADLTITKQGTAEIDENQSYVFEVTDANDAFVSRVVINGDGRATIKGLQVGKYTVTEITNWSWRYTPDANSKEITLSPTENNTVAFTNTRANNKWLNGGNFAKNLFNGGNIISDFGAKVGINKTAN